jgi:hypothetical protein
MPLTQLQKREVVLISPHYRGFSSGRHDSEVFRGRYAHTEEIDEPKLTESRGIPYKVLEGVVGSDGDGFVRGSVTGLCPPLDSLKLL